MSEYPETVKESASIIQEIENQLEKILSKRKEDIEKSLAGAILKEKENAHKMIGETEKDIDSERESLREFRILVAENEAERDAIIDEMRERQRRILLYQEELGDLAKRTVEETKKISELSRKLETLRNKTVERASFLKKDLRERFGIVSEISERGDGVETPVDLDEELEKLRKIKELLVGESREFENSGNAGRDEWDGKYFQVKAGDPSDIRIPEIRELVQSAAPSFEVEGLTDPRKSENEADRLAETLERMRKSEFSGNGNEISYFQNGGRLVLDGEKLFSLLEDGVAEAQKLSLKLGETETPKDKFLIKHDLINNQEKLRKSVLKIVRWCEKNESCFPGRTKDVLNLNSLKGIQERLSAENWANSEDLTSFEKDLKTLKASYRTAAASGEIYLKSLLEDLGIA